MKVQSWMQFLNGDKKNVSSEQINDEMVKLKKDQACLKETIHTLKKTADEEKIVLLGGAGDRKKLQEIKSEISESISKLESMGLVVERLRVLFISAQTKESEDDLYKVDLELQAKHDEREKLATRFLEVAGEAAGLWYLLSEDSRIPELNCNSFPDIRGVNFSGVDRGLFTKKIKEIRDGKCAIPREIKQLNDKREMIIKDGKKLSS